jgi:hypothetical protein
MNEGTSKNDHRRQRTTQRDDRVSLHAHIPVDYPEPPA